MAKKDIVVIGASAGGFQALKQLVQDLGDSFRGSVFIVWHMSPNVRGILPQVLGTCSNLPAVHATDNESIRPAHIYIAPPDRHLIIQKGSMRITRGPKENRFRPAVDPLFRSAAYEYGTRVIGVVLSGALDDGSAGLLTIKEYGGTAIVQDPLDAEVASMPENAIKTVQVDYVVPVAEIGKLIAKLSNTPSAPQKTLNMKDNERTEMELRMALEENGLHNPVFKFGELTPFTCPECHGVLTLLREGNTLRYRCHTGHAFSADSLLAAVTEHIEETLWSAIRSVQESVLLLNHLGDHFAEVNQPKVAAAFFRKAKEAEQRASQVRLTVTNHEQLSFESIIQQSETNGTDSK